MHASLTLTLSSPPSLCRRIVALIAVVDTCPFNLFSFCSLQCSLFARSSREVQLGII